MLSRRILFKLTIKSFGEEKNWNAEEDEEVDNLLAVVLGVVSNIFEEDCPPGGQLDTRLSDRTERVIVRVRTAQKQQQVAYTVAQKLSLPFWLLTWLKHLN